MSFIRKVFLVTAAESLPKTLEDLVDTHTLPEVVGGLLAVCKKKAEHLKADKEAVRPWKTKALQLDQMLQAWKVWGD